MKAYFDASAFTTLILQDAGWSEIENWIAATMIEPSLSDFGWGEFNSAVGLRVRSGNLSSAGGGATIAEAEGVLLGWGRVATTPGDIREATELVAQFDLGLKLPDALHIAIARRRNLPLITLDRRQDRAAERIGLATMQPAEGSPIA